MNLTVFFIYILTSLDRLSDLHNQKLWYLNKSIADILCDWLKIEKRWIFSDTIRLFKLYGYGLNALSQVKYNNNMASLTCYFAQEWKCQSWNFRENFSC